MPCFTGRASHILLKKDCQDGFNCGCHPIAAFGVGKLICDKKDEFVNSNKPIVTQLVCDLLQELFEENGCVPLLSEDLPEIIPFLPEKHCKFTLTIVTPAGVGTSKITTTIIVEDRVILDITQTTESGSFTLDQYFVDGILCVSCDNS